MAVSNTSNYKFSLKLLPATAEDPQGAKRGSILFLIIVNDLWKFVDDVSFSEIVSSNKQSVT